MKRLGIILLLICCSICIFTACGVFGDNIQVTVNNSSTNDADTGISTGDTLDVVEVVNEEVGEYYNLDNNNEMLIISKQMMYSLVLEDYSSNGSYFNAACCSSCSLIVLLTVDNDTIITSYTSETITFTYNERKIILYRA